MKKIAAAAGRILLLLFIYLASQFVVAMVVMMAHIIPLVFAMITSGEGIDMVWITEETIRSLSSYLPLILILSVIISVLFYLLIYRKRKADLKVFCSFRALNPLMILSLLILGLSLNVLLDYLLTLVSRIQAFHNLFSDYSDYSTVLLGGSFIFSLIATGIIAPIFEELLFRGLIFGELKKITDVRLALVIQALIFGVFHLNIIQGTYAFLIGLVLGFLYYRSNSLLSPILMHITFNASTIIISHFLPDVKLENWNVPILIAASVLCIVFGFIILKNRQFRQHRVPAGPEPSDSEEDGSETAGNP